MTAEAKTKTLKTLIYFWNIWNLYFPPENIFQA